MQATIFNTVKFNRSKLRNRIRTWKVPAVFRNKFVFTGFVFVIWMAFFDQNNLLVQTERLRALHEAESKAEYYLEETEIARKQLNELLTNEQTLEKFAREKYYMKKPNEDVFVIMK